MNREKEERFKDNFLGKILLLKDPEERTDAQNFVADWLGVGYFSK